MFLIVSASWRRKVVVGVSSPRLQGFLGGSMSARCYRKCGYFSLQRECSWTYYRLSSEWWSVPCSNARQHKVDFGVLSHEKVDFVCFQDQISLFYKNARTILVIVLFLQSWREMQVRVI